MMTENEMMMYDTLVDYGVATADELSLVFQTNRLSWHETFELVVWARTGCSSYEQWYNEVVLDDITIAEEEE